MMFDEATSGDTSSGTYPIFHQKSEANNTCSSWYRILPKGSVSLGMATTHLRSSSALYGRSLAVSSRR